MFSLYDGLKQLNSAKMRQRVENATQLHQKLIEIRSTLKRIVKEANQLAVSAKDFQITAVSMYNNINSLPIDSSPKGTSFDALPYTQALQNYEKNRYRVVWSRVRS